MSEQTHRSPEEVERIMADADGALGAAGHRVTDPAARESIRKSISGEISVEEAKQQILQQEGLA